MKEIDPNEILFNEAMVALASLCSFTLTDQVMKQYDRIFSQIGYGAAAKGLSKIVATRDSGDRFPSVTQIISAIENTISDEGMATEIADSIWNAVATYGQDQEKEAIKKLGPIAGRVIESVGWRFLCEQETSAAMAIKSQLRRSADAAIERSKNKSVDTLLLSSEQKVLK